MTMTRGQEALDLLQRSEGEPRRKLLLRGGYVLSMDPAIGNLTGDVLE